MLLCNRSKCRDNHLKQKTKPLAPHFDFCLSVQNLSVSDYSRKLSVIGSVQLTQQSIIMKFMFSKWLPEKNLTLHSSIIDFKLSDLKGRWRHGEEKEKTLDNHQEI